MALIPTWVKKLTTFLIPSPVLVDTSLKFEFRDQKDGLSVSPDKKFFVFGTRPQGYIPIPNDAKMLGPSPEEWDEIEVTYNANDEPTLVIYKKDGVQLYDITVSYSGTNLPLSAVYRRGGIIESTITLTYDSNDNVTKIIQS